MPGTNRETLLRKVKDICHTNVSVCHIVLPVSANGESVSSNVCEFGRKYFIIFAFREANFVSSIKANVSRCGRQGTTWAYGPNLVWGGGGGTVLVCPTALLTQCTYTTLFEILPGPPIFKDFPVGGEHFLKRDLSVR